MIPEFRLEKYKKMLVADAWKKARRRDAFRWVVVESLPAHIIEKLGGPGIVAAAMGWRYETVNNYRVRGMIPIHAAFDLEKKYGIPPWGMNWKTFKHSRLCPSYKSVCAFWCYSPAIGEKEP